MDWTGKQMMAVALARQIEDHKTYIIGTGLPLVGAVLAKHTHAPGARLVFESGIMEGNPQELPYSVADLRINHQASALWPQYRYFGFLSLHGASGRIAAGFLGGAQIDPYGNLNSTCIGDYARPDSRFSGSGGANGIATFCDTVITMKHEVRRFTGKVDYITSPGWIDGPGGREKAGLDPARGPRAVITELGVMRFGETDKRMYLAEYFPGLTPEYIQSRTGFPLDVSGAVESEAPRPEILDILLRKVDPKRNVV
ncbi:MAG: CoA-transferase subunit beta [Deltaproteobacteria bacterium]|jgi:glutaconate CoA-transferase subunit B|nr:CoA-transferase subunit beta [Deltaproteobacteria bacterium]